MFLSERNDRLEKEKARHLEYIVLSRQVEHLPSQTERNHGQAGDFLTADPVLQEEEQKYKELHRLSLNMTKGTKRNDPGTIAGMTPGTTSRAPEPEGSHIHRMESQLGFASCNRDGS